MKLRIWSNVERSIHRLQTQMFVDKLIADFLAAGNERLPYKCNAEESEMFDKINSDETV